MPGTRHAYRAGPSELSLRSSPFDDDGVCALLRGGGGACLSFASDDIGYMVLEGFLWCEMSRFEIERIRLHAADAPAV